MTTCSVQDNMKHATYAALTAAAAARLMPSVQAPVTSAGAACGRRPWPWIGRSIVPARRCGAAVLGTRTAVALNAHRSRSALGVRVYGCNSYVFCCNLRGTLTTAVARQVSAARRSAARCGWLHTRATTPAHAHSAHTATQTRTRSHARVHARPHAHTGHSVAQVVERECSALLDFRRYLVSNGHFRA